MVTKSQIEHEGWTPVPDPTLLTTQLTQREISALKELIQQEIIALDAKLGLTKTLIEDVFTERFRNVETKFNELDKLRNLTAAANHEAIAAALSAQKESTAKTEAAFTKQIDQLQVLLNAVSRASDEKIDDLKTRLDLTEGKSRGIGEGWGVIVGAVGLITGVLIAIAHYLKL